MVVNVVCYDDISKIIIIGVNLTLSQEFYVIDEQTGFVEICAILDGELEGTVDAMIFTVPGSAEGECYDSLCNSDNVY